MPPRGSIALIEARSPRPHIFSRARLPRLGCVLLGTILRDAGWDVSVFIEDIAPIDWSRALDADIIGISTITSTATRAWALADKFRAAGKPVIFGGAHPTFCPDEALEHCDYVIRGEAERMILPLCEAILRDADPGPLPGLSRRRRSGEIDHQPLAPMLSDLDENPIPDYSLVHGRRESEHVVSIATSRGCPYDCRFCSVIKMFGRRYRFNSEDRVIEEVRRNSPGAGHTFFCDDNFTANPRRTKAILRRMRDEGIHIDWSAQVRVESARDLELMELMAATGCSSIYSGLESVNERTLRAYNKHQDLKKITHAIKTFHEYGIHVHGMFVLGSDEDDVETIRQTTRYCREMGVDSVQLLILTPLPGTETYRELEESGRLFHHEWDRYDGAHVVYEPRRMTAYELQTESLKAHRDFYSYASIARYALRRDYDFAKIRLYARLQTDRLMRMLRPYVKSLKQQSSGGLLAPARAIMRRRRKKVVGVLSEWLDENSSRFLIEFLNNLGIRAVTSEQGDVSKSIHCVDHIPAAADHSSPTIDQAIAAKIKQLKEKSDCVLVPVSAAIRQQLEALNRRGITMREWLESAVDWEEVACIVPEIDSDAIYKTCVQIGLGFNLRLSTIRAAYAKTALQLNLSPVY